MSGRDLNVLKGILSGNVTAHGDSVFETQGFREIVWPMLERIKELEEHEVECGSCDAKDESIGMLEDRIETMQKEIDSLISDLSEYKKDCVCKH